MRTPPQTHSERERDTQMARFGLRIAADLSEHAEQMPADISERLRFAREKALAAAHQAQASRPAVATDVLVQGRQLAMGGESKPGSRWYKLGTVLPLLLLALGLLLIQQSQWYQQIKAAAEVDAALLSDRLPPAAYGDPGFTEYLNEEEQPAQAETPVDDK